ncbi:MAG: VOC family protein [Myxococcota bacterium]
MTTPDPVLTPRLIVRGAARAIDVYTEALGAECVERFATPEGKIVHAAMSVRGATFSIVDEDGTHSFAPTGPGATPVLLHLMVDDPDATAERLVAAGGKILIPIDDRFYGHREGRVADPFGHAWILSRKIADLDDETIQKGVDAWAAG